MPTLLNESLMSLSCKKCIFRKDLDIYRYSWGMARIAKKIVRFVLVVLLFEFLSASFFTAPERSSREGISYNVPQSSLLLPAFVKEEKEKKHSSIYYSKLNIFTHSRNLTAYQNVENQKNLFHNQVPRFALFCSLRIWSYASISRTPVRQYKFSVLTHCFKRI